MQFRRIPGGDFASHSCSIFPCELNHMMLYGLESLYRAYLKLSVNFAVQVKLKGLAKVSECIAGDVEMSTTGAP